MPTGVSERSALRFLRSQQDWVLAALKRLEVRTQWVKSWAPSRYCDGARIPYQGRFHQLSLRPAPLTKIYIEFGEHFVAAVPETLWHQDCRDEVRAALIGWLKIQAKARVEYYVQKHSGRHRLHPRTVKIKTQKSRWGSCGIHDDIHINWLLILSPPEVLEYVVVHELCHIRFRNHSSHFWNLVADHLPDYQQQRVWLKTHGGSLMMGL